MCVGGWVGGEGEKDASVNHVCWFSSSPGVEQNGEVFRENKGTSCTLALIRYSTPRRMALKVMRQLILLEGKGERGSSRSLGRSYVKYLILNGGDDLVDFLPSVFVSSEGQRNDCYIQYSVIIRFTSTGGVGELRLKPLVVTVDPLIRHSPPDHLNTVINN